MCLAYKRLNCNCNGLNRFPDKSLQIALKLFSRPSDFFLTGFTERYPLFPTDHEILINPSVGLPMVNPQDALQVVHVNSAPWRWPCTARLWPLLSWAHGNVGGLGGFFSSPLETPRSDCFHQCWNSYRVIFVIWNLLISAIHPLILFLPNSWIPIHSFRSDPLSSSCLHMICFSVRNI